MDPSTFDTSTNDGVFNTPEKEAVKLKLEQMDNTSDEPDEKLYEMRSFARGDSTSASLRIDSEDFEHISVSAIGDIEKKDEHIGGKSEHTELESSSSSKDNSGSDTTRKAEGSVDDETNSSSKINKSGTEKVNESTTDIAKDILKISGSERGDEIDTHIEDVKVSGKAEEDELQTGGESLVSDNMDKVGLEISHVSDDKVNDSLECSTDLNNTTDDAKMTGDGLTKSGGSTHLLAEPVSTERRVSFSLEEYMEERETSFYNAELRRASEYIPREANEHRKYRKHSSGDLHSRLKTRKLLGVGETDDGDVHRSKLSQILGHSDQLYIKLPNGLRLWQIVLSSLLTVMAVWALVFPSHFFKYMYEMDSSGFTFPIRLYASALVCISIVYWSTIQVSDRDSIRLVLLSSIVFFALQSLMLMTWFPWLSETPSAASLMCSVTMFAARLLVICVSSYFYWITCKDTKHKDVKYYR